MVLLWYMSTCKFYSCMLSLHHFLLNNGGCFYDIYMDLDTANQSTVVKLSEAD